MGVLVISEQNKRAIESLMPFPFAVVENMKTTGVQLMTNPMSVEAWIQELVDQGDAVCAFGVGDCGGHYSGLREAIYRIQSGDYPSVDIPYGEPKWSHGEEDHTGEYELYETLAYGWMECESENRYGGKIDYWFCQGCWNFQTRANGLMTPFVMEEVL